MRTSGGLALPPDEAGDLTCAWDGAPSAETDPFWEARVRKPDVAPAGYTRHTLVTEWLTLNCSGDWACRSGAASLTVRFRRPEDLERTLSRFGGRLSP